MSEYICYENGSYEAADIHLSPGIQEPYVYDEYAGDSLVFLCLIGFLISAAVTMTVTSFLYGYSGEKEV